MTVTFQLPDEVERRLRARQVDIEAEARESFLVDLYRRGEIAHPDLSRALGLDRMQTEQVLFKHKVTEDLGTVQDYLDDTKTLENLRSKR